MNKTPSLETGDPLPFTCSGCLIALGISLALWVALVGAAVGIVNLIRLIGGG